MYCSSILKKNIYIYIYFIPPSSFLSLLSLLSFLFSIQTQTPSLLSLPSLFLLCWVRCLGRWSWFVVGLWVQCLGRGWWCGLVVVVVFGVVVGCRLWSGPVFGSWSWIDKLGWSGPLVMDQWAGMKWVVGRGSAAEGGRWSWIGKLGWSGSLVVDRRLKWVVSRWSWLGHGRGWVVAEVAPVMIFF